MQKVQHEFNFLNKKNIDIDAIKRKPQPISIWNLISTKAIPFWSHTFRLTLFLPIDWSFSETHVLGCKVTASSNSVRFSRPIEILFLSSEIWFWERGKSSNRPDLGDMAHLENIALDQTLLHNAALYGLMRCHGGVANQRTRVILYISDAHDPRNAATRYGSTLCLLSGLIQHTHDDQCSCGRAKLSTMSSCIDSFVLSSVSERSRVTQCEYWAFASGS